MNVRIGWQLGTLICLAIVVGGCRPQTEVPATPSPTEPSLPLRVLVVDRERWGNEIERRWNADAQTPIDVAFVAGTDFSIDRIEGFDVVIYSSEWTAALADAGAILGLDERRFESEDWNAKDVLPHESGTRVRWGKETVGISLGHTPWVLAYRESRVSAEEIDALSDWQSFDSWLEAKMSAAVTAGQSQSILGIPTRGTNAAEVFLARVGATVRHRGAFSGFFDLGQTRPLLITEPFVDAMKWLGSPATLPGDHSPEECWKSLIQGEIEIAILPLPIRGDRSESASSQEEFDGQDETALEAISDLRFSRIPGSARVFVSGAGWRDRGPDESRFVPYLGTRGSIASIPRSSRRAGAAWGFLQWLGSSKAQSLWAGVASEAFPTRYSSLGSVDRWLPEGLSDSAVDDVIDILRSAQEETVTMAPLRVPAGRDFLMSLADAARAVRAGSPPQQALEESQRQWEALIEKIGSGDFLVQNEEGLGL